MKKSMGSGGVKRRGQGRGSVAPSPPDRRSERPPAQPLRILEGRAIVAATLDGEAIRGIAGFHAGTASRCLFVPYGQADDSAMAVVLCQSQGLLHEKLAAMDADTREATYALTLVTPILPC